MTIIEPPLTPYTSEQEIAYVFSQLGVTLRVKDPLDEISDPLDPLIYAIEDATDTINQYCLLRYTAEELAANRWVRKRATILACQSLSGRRGNPQQFAPQAERVLDELERVQSGNLDVPRLPKQIPSHTNLLIDRAFVQEVREVHPDDPYYDRPYQ